MTSGENEDKGLTDSSLITDMIAAPDEKQLVRGDLIVEPERDQESHQFDKQVEQTLRETEQAVLDIDSLTVAPEKARSWHSSRKLIEEFKPVPWFIWRLTNFVMGKTDSTHTPVPEGLVLGLRRLLFAAASDQLLGSGTKVNSVRKALEILSADIVVATSVIHAISRRLATRQFERIWRPMLDDAFIRARIGFIVGKRKPEFGGGRGMLAGFSGRSGLIILIASGELEQARSSLEMLAAGGEIADVGMKIYRCDPLQVSAMVLSAAGCGRDAAFGVASYSTPASSRSFENDQQKYWTAAFSLVERLRVSRWEGVDSELLQIFGLEKENELHSIQEEVKLILRRGHGWNWLV